MDKISWFIKSDFIYKSFDANTNKCFLLNTLMVTLLDLQEDYKEIEKSGELNNPLKQKNYLIPKIIIWTIILSISFWTFARFY